MSDDDEYVLHAATIAEYKRMVAKARAERDDLQAEVERLTAERDAWVEAFKRMDAKAARLTAAGDAMARWIDVDCLSSDGSSEVDAWHKAKGEGR